MAVLLLVDLDEEDREQLAGLPVEVREVPISGVFDELDDTVDAVTISSFDPSRAVATTQLIHRARPDVQVVALVNEETEATLRRQVRFAADVPADLELVRTDAADLVDRLTELCQGAALRRRHRQVLARIDVRASSGPRVPLVGATLGSLLEHAPLGVVVADEEQRVLATNRAATQLLSLPQAVAGRALSELFEDRGLVPRLTAEATTADAADPWPEETTAGPADTLLDVSAAMTQLDDGRRVVMLLVGDATARGHAEQERDVLSEQVAMMGRVWEAVVGTQDPEEALRLITEQVVPVLADWVSMQLYDERGITHTVVAKHSDPALAPLTEMVQQRLGTAMSEGSPSRRLARGEPPMLLPHIDAEMLRAFVPEEDVRETLVAMGVESAIAVPLEGRRTRVGSMVLINGAGSARLGEQELAIAVEVGRRAGIALETLHLYTRQRVLAEELQRSMLTEPPSPDHAEVAVRYKPASQEAQVGGDWYDAYLQPDGSIVLSIGDVVGHDHRAAAAMGQLRGLLRGIGYARDSGPAEMLRSLDAATEGLLPGVTATAVVTRVARPGGHGPGDGEVSVCWSNAGHPPPFLLRADGEPVLLQAEHTDVILGVAAELPRAESAAQMRPGDTLVLYSDGLIERRGRDYDEGIDLLREVLLGNAQRPLQELCDHLLDRLVPAEPDDDVALVALRLR